MNDLLTLIISWQFLFISLFISGLTYILRNTIENLYIKTKTNHIFQKVILPIIPMLIGAIFGIVSYKFPYPEGLNVLSGRIVFCMVGGLFSGSIYGVIKNIIKSKETK